MQGSANLNLMIKAARKAGRALVKDFREVENLQVSSKAAGDFVTRANVAAERIIREDLMDARPNYGWLAEETDPLEGKDPTRRWIVDPLDGTANFLHGLPHWSVSIALEFKSEIIAAVVFDPAKDELFVAEKGAGTFMNDKRLRVSNRNSMLDCIFATGIPQAGKRTLPATLHDLAQMMPACAGVRQWGSTALDMAYVAAGRFDGYWERELQPWEYSAGLLLVREAGGFTAPIRDGADIAERGELIAANSGVFDGLTRVLRKRPE
ncbi:inositol monophosphatase family protein [Roseinatronobacter sp. S2]|uniref:inositol monophosphatase family protein n=1 Tax=Roseinatronobacter sp. S2 TaxID=3035471 RepID=UPI0024101689|nr:inositol monophosphatase family protein [Roseinatronobacter sp. S2]WFE73919.1 inositol monophosphatase family protein [Roseinatronobacter sp. S2]